MTIGHTGITEFRTGGGVGSALLDTGEITCYAFFADGGMEIGVDKGYTVIATAGNTNIEVAHYAAATITFATADNSITDSAAGLVTFLSADTIVIKGSLSNDGVYTIAAGTGGTAGHFHTNEALLANEAAGAVVSFYKRTAHANIVVQDTKTGRMWSQTTSNGEKVGVLSNGTLAWTGIVFPLYSSANTISMIAGNILRITGGAALTQFHPGDLLQCGGFANAINNLANLYVLSVTANAGNLDIVVNPGNEVLIAEGAVGDTIGLVTRCIYNYMAGACLGNLSLYSDWRVPNLFEILSISDGEAPTSNPNAVAFPGWPNAIEWTSTSTSGNPAVNGVYIGFGGTLSVSITGKTSALIVGLVRS